MLTASRVTVVTQVLLCVMLLISHTPLQVRLVPKKCSIGRFSTDTFLLLLLLLSLGCTICEAGYYSSATERGACKPCEIGLFSPPGAATCTPACPAGFGADATNVPIYVNVFFMLDKTESICEQWVEEIETAEQYCMFEFCCSSLGFNF